MEKRFDRRILVFLIILNAAGARATLAAEGATQGEIQDEKWAATVDAKFWRADRPPENEGGVITVSQGPLMRHFR
ncbi:hypothetical protein WDW86_07430 [Bdellovibrionota bacterium FG-2]